jgi:mxaJ protein
LYSAFRTSIIGVALLMTPAIAAEQLKVCADPNNLPFSDSAREGYENRIASVLADELGMKLEYVWWPQRRGLVSDALNEGICDLIAGIGDVPGILLTYPPYYRSTYAFVTRRGRPIIHGFDDPQLRTLRVGVQLIGEDGVNTPPATALAQRGIIDNVTGYLVLGDYSQANPPARIIDAVAAGDIDVAVAWGPLAGYFAAKQTPPLTVRPVPGQFDGPVLPMAFDISMGLRLDEGALRLRIERAISRRKTDIDAILAEYQVPRLDGAAR